MSFDNSASSFTLTEKQFADAIGLSLSLVRVLRRDGRLSCVRVNKRVLYTRQDVDAFLAAHRQTAEAA
jgi:hypothetical protein